MKTFAAVIGAVMLSLNAAGQGTVNFANGAAGVNAPIVYYPPFLVSTSNGPWLAMLFAGPAGVPAAELTDSIVSGSPAVLGATPGYVLGGARTIAGIPSGSQAVLQIRAWHAGLWGTSYPTGAELDPFPQGFGIESDYNHPRRWGDSNSEHGRTNVV